VTALCCLSVRLRALRVETVGCASTGKDLSTVLQRMECDTVFLQMATTRAHAAVANRVGAARIGCSLLFTLTASEVPIY